MAEGKVIQPDLKFVERIMNSGGESLKKCYQCATCSVVCNITPDDRPFPRKEMIHAQWGLKDKLFSNPDIWLCHQCSDCTAYCPRGAKPGEVLGAVRQLSIEHFALFKSLGRALNESKFLLFLFAVPVLILGWALWMQGHLGIPTPTGPHWGYAETFMAVHYIDPIFGAAAAFALLGFIVGVTRYWKALSADGAEPTMPIGSAIIAMVTEFLAHRKFKKCQVTVDRSRSHLFVFYGFLGLAITTTWAIFYLYGLQIESPYPLYDPMKILGNLSGIALLLGISWVISNRKKNEQKAGKGSYYDWLFINIVLFIVVTGLLTEILRLLNIPDLAYPVYFIHLTVIFFLFAYAPYSKMAHMVYRATALVYAKYTGRDLEKA